MKPKLDFNLLIQVLSITVLLQLGSPSSKAETLAQCPSISGSFVGYAAMTGVPFSFKVEQMGCDFVTFKSRPKSFFPRAKETKFTYPTDKVFRKKDLNDSVHQSQYTFERQYYNEDSLVLEQYYADSNGNQIGALDKQIYRINQDGNLVRTFFQVIFENGNEITNESELKEVFIRAN